MSVSADQAGTNAEAIPVLDGLRGLAALIVMVSHTANQWFGGALFGAGFGQIGVMLFFVLSGFLMGHLYLRQPWSSAAARRFAWNRFGRVVPLYVVVVLFSFAIHQAGSPVWAYDISTTGGLIDHLLLVTGVSVLWSIGPEVIFYFLFALFWFLRLRARGWALALAALLVLYSALPLNMHTNSWHELHGRLVYFAVGTALGAGWQSWQLPRAPARAAAALALLSIALLVISSPPILPHAVRLAFGLELAPINADNAWQLPYYWVLTVGLFVANLWASPAWLCGRFLRWSGQLSYGLYLTHLLVLKNLPPPAELGWQLSVPLFFAGSYVVAWLLHVLLDKPARNYFRRFGQSRYATAG